MRRHSLVLVLGALIVLSGSLSASDYVGDWIGRIGVHGGDSELNVRLLIEGGTAIQFFPRDGGGWRLVEPVNAQFTSHGNNAVFHWLNSGGIWTETQSYHLSLIDEDTIRVVWLRMVNNRAPDEDGDPWYLTGDGYLYRDN